MNKNKATLFQWNNYLKFQYLPSWAALGFLWLLTRFPFRWTLAIGRNVGLLAYYLLKSRRKVCDINLELAYPEKTKLERDNIARQVFQHIGMAVSETAWAWHKWPQSPAEISIYGEVNLENALQQGKGVILLQAHFTLLEFCAPIIGSRWPISAVYDQPKNPMFDNYILMQRSKYLNHLIDNSNIRDMVRRLRRGEIVWYSPDQTVAPYRGGINVNFFNQPALTTDGTARIVAMTGAVIVPFTPTRVDNGKRYSFTFHEPLELDTQDTIAATQFVNNELEKTVRSQPEQYLWAHKRFKPPSEEHLNPYR